MPSGAARWQATATEREAPTDEETYTGRVRSEGIAGAVGQNVGWENTISGKEAEDQPFSFTEQLLHGQVAGVEVIRYPGGGFGIRIRGTECKDEKDSFYDADGKLYSEKRVDKDWYYWADCEEAYDEETLPYMINEGKHSYFSRIVTEEVTKIINIPILKNAGPTVTLCLKNLAYGAISNTARLHKPLWAETCAQVPCFPPLRDKVVLNIVDGLIGCYHGGPGANPQFIAPYHRLLVGSDPVAVDRIGYDIVLAKRLEMAVQKEPSPRGTGFLEMAAGYKLGVADPALITHTKVDLS